MTSLRANPTWDVSCVNARHGPLLIKILGDLGKLDQIKLVTFDASEETLKGIEDGHIFATIAQDPYNYGFKAVSILAGLCHGDEVSVPIVGCGSEYVGAEAISQKNIAEYRKRLNARQESLDKKASKKAAKAA